MQFLLFLFIPKFILNFVYLGKVIYIFFFIFFLCIKVWVFSKKKSILILYYMKQKKKIRKFIHKNNIRKESSYTRPQSQNMPAQSQKDFNLYSKECVYFKAVSSLLYRYIIIIIFMQKKKKIKWIFLCFSCTCVVCTWVQLVDRKRKTF